MSEHPRAEGCERFWIVGSADGSSCRCPMTSVPPTQPPAAPESKRPTGAIVPERQRCICDGGVCLDHCRACNYSGRDLEEPCIADPDWEPDDDDLARREGLPAAPESDVRLTEAERGALADAAATLGTDDYPGLLFDEVERIVAERLRVVEGERDAAEERLRGAYSIGAWADLTAERNREFRRAESAEAAHEAEKAAHERLRAEVEALADDLRQRRDRLLEEFEGPRSESRAKAYGAVVSQITALLGGGEAR